MTLGEARVRLSFNPSANADVEDIKRRSADCIDWCHAQADTADPEKARALSLAMTYYETAAMYAVKAATG